ncbi:MAG TPA: hypothetical protein VNB03_11980 [Casimicrobiaceae bacterium]|nr:hypothetical protein [Casimicrobiaceae bacterium]
MTPRTPRRRQHGRIPMWLVGILGAIVALAGVEFYAIQKYGRVGVPPTPVAAKPGAAGSPAAEALAPIAPIALPVPEGWLDEPATESVVGTKLAMNGWALAQDGIKRVEIRVGDRVFEARYGTAREDVAKVKPGFPDNPNGGFTFEGNFADLSPMRHDVTVVAIGKNGREAVLGRRSLIPPAAMTQWKALLDERPALARQPFYFLMMTSGVGLGGADEVESQYADYRSRTQKVGMAVPILYMRTTRGAAGDWAFDPDFDTRGTKCANHAVAEDTLNGVMRFAIEKRVPVQFILNGGIWGDASCETPAWDLTDHLEQDKLNCQWTENDEVFPDDYLKGHAGSTESPQLARSLTYNVYAKPVRVYKRRNLQAAATLVARFARENPELFVGIVLDSDTYMNPFFRGHKTFDYNPGMLRQYRDWLRGSGPYAGRGEGGAPDLRAYRRKTVYTLAQVAAIARQPWTSWDQVDPPREFPGSFITPEVPAGRLRIWDDPWWHLWEEFRKHVVDLHYDELSTWARETGIPADRIFSAQGFIRPDPGRNPFAVTLASHHQNYDSSGVSVEGAIPRDGHLGAVIYGEAARNDVPMEVDHTMFATFARMDEGWGVVEFNSADLKTPKAKPPYAWTYGSLRDMYNYSAREVSIMAWNGSNGIHEEHPDYLPYTAWRNTANEDAMRDFLVSHADLPFGAKLWTFGTARLASDDGWTTSRGTLTPGRSHVAVAPDRGVVELVSPIDQVIRARRIDLALVRAWSGPTPTSIAVHARLAPDTPWREIGRASGGERVALRWPADWREAIAVQVKLELAYAADVTGARVVRVLLYPAQDAYRGGIRGH